MDRADRVGHSAARTGIWVADFPNDTVALAIVAFMPAQPLHSGVTALYLLHGGF